MGTSEYVMDGFSWHPNGTLMTNNRNPPSARISDSMSVGKCGDADGQQGDFECESNRDQCWLPSTLNNTDNLLCSSQQSLECDDKNEADSSRRRITALLSKSSDSAYLKEPPKLRRALAYMELEDGDCERNDCYQPLVNFSLHNDDNERTTLVPNRRHRLSNRWRSRMSKAFKQNPFSFLIPKKDNRSSNSHQFVRQGSTVNETEANETATYSSDIDNYAPGHLPSGDLFHQFNY